MKLVSALVLNSFGYADAAGHNPVRLHAGEVHLIRADLVPGLKAEGFIECDDAPAQAAVLETPASPEYMASDPAAAAVADEASGVTMTPGDPPIPESWETEKWFLRKNLAMKISGAPVEDSTTANAIIKAEVDKRNKA